MTKSKTVIEWLNEAKEHGYEWADAAIYNAGNGLSSYGPYGQEDPCDKEYEVESLKVAINSFWWSKSSQGLDFWNNIYESL